MTDLTFWDRLERSELLKPAAIGSLRTQFRSLQDDQKGPASPADWLKQSGILSEFQAQLLQGGFDRSFTFGEYTISQRRPHVLGWATYAARHTPTGHPVQLCFLPGVGAADVELWNAAIKRLGVVSPLKHPAMLGARDFVELHDYRFFVIDAAGGPCLADRVGARERIPWASACSLVRLLATAVNELHQEGLAHGNINSREVYLEGNGYPRLAPPLHPARTYRESSGESSSEADSPHHYIHDRDRFNAVMPADDIFALGVLLYRLIRGETPQSWMSSANEGERDIHSAVQKLAKYSLPSVLVTLLTRVLRVPATEPIRSSDELLQVLETIPNSDPNPPTAPKPSQTADAFAEWLARWRPPATDIATDPVEPTSTPHVIDSLSLGSVNFAIAETNNVERRKRRSSKLNLFIWSGCAAALLATVVFVYRISNSSRAQTAHQPKTPRTEQVATPTRTPDDGTVETPPTPARASHWTQNLVDDNGSTLWESPTAGPTIDLRHIAPNPSILLVLRPHELSQQPESARLAQALGPEVQAAWATFSSELPVPIESIEELLIGFYPDEELGYDRLIRIALNTPTLANPLVEQWAARGYMVDAANPELWVSEAKAIGIRRTSTKEQTPDEPSNELVSTVIFGKADLVKAGMSASASNMVAGPLADVAARSDQARHLTLLGTTGGVFNERGESLLPEKFRQLLGKSTSLIPREVRAVMFSLHLDEGVYLEVAFDRTADIKSEDLAQTLETRWQTARDELIAFVDGLPSEAHWDKVRRRFDDMVVDVSRRMRFGMEYDQVLVNAWLPPMAAHNLVSASELTLSVAGGGSPIAATGSPGSPTTLTQLLQAKRTLKNDNPPDLNVLLDSLQTEVRQDFPGLPFPFEIRISNVDLGEAGITRNQRLGALDLVDQPLEQVLTQICFLANPDKNATGPSDERCALVWVVTRDPDGNSEMILVTTRSAAAKNGWELPQSFRANGS